ncbi:MAG: hypothetical protein ACR2N3_12270 [Pyrinomonadaceae bacterium]
MKKRRQSGENLISPDEIDSTPINSAQSPDNKAIKEDREVIENRKVKNRVKAKA